MNRRIFGIETEYGVTCTNAGTRRMTPDEVSRYLFRRVVAWGRSSNVFLGNGSRLYLDVGAHPEYATAECDDVRQLIAQDTAGQLIIEGLVADAQDAIDAEGIEGTVYAFRNNTDSAGNSYGCHENYLVGREASLLKVTDALVPFLIARQLLCGAGKVLHTPHGARYCVSQRSEHIWEGVSSATTRSRPIINTRDEPHADAERYRRLHVIVGDTNMSQTTTALKVCSADLVLRLVESGVALPDFRLEQPIRAIRQISDDPTGRAVVKLQAGGTVSALDMLYAYLDEVRAFVEREGAPTPLHAGSIDLWERTLIAVETGRLAKVGTEIDWVIKKRLVEAYAARHGLALGDARIAQLDLAYHDVTRDRGLFHLLERRGQAATVIGEDEALAAKDVPPQTTRAKLRGDFVRAATEDRRDFSVDWVHLKLNDVNQRTVLLRDPFSSSDARVDRLLDLTAEPPILPEPASGSSDSSSKGTS